MVAVGLQQRPPFAEGTAGDDLHDVVSETRRGGIVFRRGDLLFGGRRPVAQERRLKARGAAALDPEVGVAPCAPPGAADVAVGDVHAAEEAHAAVDDGDLAVVAVIDLAGEERELDVQEREHLDSFAAHPLEKVLFHAAAPHVVVEDAHLDPLPGFRDQRVAQAAARCVVAEDVILDVDVVLCAGDFGQQGLHLRPPVGVGGDPAAVERDRVARVGQQGGQRAVRFGQVGTVGVLGFFELHGDALARPARDDALFGEVLAEEKIEDQPHDGGQHQHDDPRQRLQRIAVVGDDDQNDAEDQIGRAHV